MSRFITSLWPEVCAGGIKLHRHHLLRCRIRPQVWTSHSATFPPTTGTTGIQRSLRKKGKPQLMSGEAAASGREVWRVLSSQKNHSGEMFTKRKIYPKMHKVILQGKGKITFFFLSAKRFNSSAESPLCSAAGMNGFRLRMNSRCRTQTRSPAARFREDFQNKRTWKRLLWWLYLQTKGHFSFCLFIYLFF